MYNQIVPQFIKYTVVSFPPLIHDSHEIDIHVMENVKLLIENQVFSSICLAFTGHHLLRGSLFPPSNVVQRQSCLSRQVILRK